MGLLLNRRREMGGGEVLPYDAKIEYLQSTGTQYIVGEDSCNKVEILFQFTANQAQARIFALGNNNNYMNIYINGSSHIATSIAMDWSTNNSVSWDQKCLVILDAINKTTSVTTPSNSYSWNNSGNPSFPTEFYLFSMNGSSNATAKMWYCKLYDGNTLIRDFIPVRVGQVGYLYDKVSKTLFGNSGSGSFTLGQDV